MSLTVVPSGARLDFPWWQGPSGRFLAARLQWTEAPLVSRDKDGDEPPVRRYVYNDVVRLDDLERLIDCSFVQPYTINSAKVIFLKPRPQSRPFKGSGNVCLTCDRILQEPFHFCCLSCKVDHVMGQGGDLSNILYVPGGPPDLGCGFPRFENLRVDGGGYDDDPGQVTPNSILEHPAQQGSCGYGGSASGGSSSNGGVPRKKKTGGGGGFFPQIVLSLGNRRKGAPHRAPLA
ncbi:hypothetical protein SETIT_4G184500v2 [Setaria italica]|uniref:Uncharacterized protein n=1 Tax=Setaria italica TaxID=4555 RepID=A0A368QVK4_SETIT|nr:hypothetical protein SETIT_4G184500v2 [Setaria italica]